MENELVVVKNLKKNYHDLKTEIEAVKDVSFSVKENEFVSIVGPSGCGKSTILSILAGLEKKSDGDINLNNDLKVGYMLQSDSLFSWRTILENCLIGLEIENNLTKENLEKLANTFESNGLNIDAFKADLEMLLHELNEEYKELRNRSLNTDLVNTDFYLIEVKKLIIQQKTYCG